MSWIGSHRIRPPVASDQALRRRDRVRPPFERRSPRRLGAPRALAPRLGIVLGQSTGAPYSDRLPSGGSLTIGWANISHVHHGRPAGEIEQALHQQGFFLAGELALCLRPLAPRSEPLICIVGILSPNLDATLEGSIARKHHILGLVAEFLLLEPSIRGKSTRSRGSLFRCLISRRLL